MSSASLSVDQLIHRKASSPLRAQKINNAQSLNTSKAENDRSQITGCKGYPRKLISILLFPGAAAR
jgi:hypothetical protein